MDSLNPKYEEDRATEELGGLQALRDECAAKDELIRRLQHEASGLLEKDREIDSLKEMVEEMKAVLLVQRLPPPNFEELNITALAKGNNSRSDPSKDEVVHKPKSKEKPSILRHINVVSKGRKAYRGASPIHAAQSSENPPKTTLTQQFPLQDDNDSRSSTPWPAVQKSVVKESETNYDESSADGPNFVNEPLPTRTDEAEWRDCLVFFLLNPSDYPFLQPDVQAPAWKTLSSRKGIKRLPGTSVSLFDYQLYAVFKLLKLQTIDANFAYLADGAGLGKTITTCAVIAVHTLLRVMMSHFKEHPENHRRADSKPEKRCPYRIQERIGHQCVCENPLAMDIAKRLVDGPTLVLTSSRLAPQFYMQADNYFTDKNRYSVHGQYEGNMMTTAERKRASLGVMIVSAKPMVMRDWRSNCMIIVSSYQRLDQLRREFRFFPELNKDEATSVDSFCPGLVVVDEAHLAGPMTKNSQLARRFTRPLYHAQCNGYPMVLFVSATPFEDNPAELLGPLDLARTPKWENVSHKMSAVRHHLLACACEQYQSIVSRQKACILVHDGDIEDYKLNLKAVLDPFMVRREGKDRFRGAKISPLPDLRVTTMQCRVPDAYLGRCQQLSDATRQKIEKLRSDITDPSGERVSVWDIFHTPEGADAVRNLKFAASFPGIVDTALAGGECRWTTKRIFAELRAAQYKPEQMSLWQRLDSWTADSTKMDALLDIIAKMNRDKTVTKHGGKKMVVFATSEAEALFIFYRLQKTAAESRSTRMIRPMWLPSAVPAERHAEYFGRFAKTGAKDPNIFVSTIWVAGTGVNQLVVANYCVMFSPPSEKKDAEQAFQRIHRLGQRQPTHQWMLVAGGNPMCRRLTARHRGRYVAEHDTAWKVYAIDPPEEEASAHVEIRHSMSFFDSKWHIGQPQGRQPAETRAALSTQPEGYRQPEPEEDHSAKGKGVQWVGEVARQALTRRFPEGYEIIYNSGAGIQCVFLAIMDSMQHQVPEDRVPTLDELQAIYPCVMAENPEFESNSSSRSSVDQEVIDQAAETLRQFGQHQVPAKHYQLGYVCPGAGDCAAAFLVPVEGNREYTSNTIIWIYNGNVGNRDVELAHFSGLCSISERPVARKAKPAIPVTI